MQTKFMNEMQKLAYMRRFEHSPLRANCPISNFESAVRFCKEQTDPHSISTADFKNLIYRVGGVLGSLPRTREEINFLEHALVSEFIDDLSRNFHFIATAVCFRHLLFIRPFYNRNIQVSFVIFNYLNYSLDNLVIPKEYL